MDEGGNGPRWHNSGAGSPFAAVVNSQTQDAVEMMQPTEHVNHPVTRLRPSTCNTTRGALQMTIGHPGNVTLTGSPAYSYCAGVMPPDTAITTSTTSAVPPGHTAAPGPVCSKTRGPGEAPV